MAERLPHLKLVAVSRGGPVNVDMAAGRGARRPGGQRAGRNARAVAEFTIGAILAETRLIRAGHEALRRGEWRGDLYRADTTGEELSELTVGMIGYGPIGAQVVRLLKPFGCRILVADPYVQLSPRTAPTASSTSPWTPCWSGPTSSRSTPGSRRRPRGSSTGPHSPG